MRKVLLSDIDGTLAGQQQHADSWRRAFEHFGIEVGLDEAWSRIGKGGDQLIPVFVRPQDCKHLGDSIKKYRDDLLKREYMSRMVPFAKARELLMRVKGAGMKIVLATSAKKDDLAFYKRLVGMGDPAEEEATNSDAQQSKPEPDIFAAAFKKAGRVSEEAVALGDTPYDAEAAGRLGILTVGLTCGGWKERDLVSAGRAEVFRDPQHLLMQCDRSVFVKDR